LGSLLLADGSGGGAAVGERAKLPSFDAGAGVLDAAFVQRLGRSHSSERSSRCGMVGEVANRSNQSNVGL
jgi:hypothetical protein